MNKHHWVILEILDSDRHKEWFGNQIIEASDGKLVAGSLYVQLGKLVSLNLVERRPEDDETFAKQRSSLRRRLYRITEQGTRQKAEEGAKDKPRSLLDRLLPGREPTTA